MQQSQTEDCMIIWDLEKDKEIESFDTDKDALFFQDENGKPYVAQHDFLTNCSQSCITKAYNFRV